jgi:predicted secreted Zn-dependent protease
MLDEQSAKWQRSSQCDSGQCVEVAASGEVILVRQSDAPDGLILSFGHSAWSDFLDGVRKGEFD